MTFTSFLSISFANHLVLRLQDKQNHINDLCKKSTVTSSTKLFHTLAFPLHYKSFLWFFIPRWFCFPSADFCICVLKQTRMSYSKQGLACEITIFQFLFLKLSLWRSWLARSNVPLEQLNNFAFKPKKSFAYRQRNLPIKQELLLLFLFLRTKHKLNPAPFSTKYFPSNRFRFFASPLQSSQTTDSLIDFTEQA